MIGSSGHAGWHVGLYNDRIKWARGMWDFIMVGSNGHAGHLNLTNQVGTLFAGCDRIESSCSRLSHNICISIMSSSPAGKEVRQLQEGAANFISGDPEHKTTLECNINEPRLTRSSTRGMPRATTTTTTTITTAHDVQAPVPVRAPVLLQCSTEANQTKIATTKIGAIKKLLEDVLRNQREERLLRNDDNLRHAQQTVMMDENMTKILYVCEQMQTTLRTVGIDNHVRGR